MHIHDSKMIMKLWIIFDFLSKIMSKGQIQDYMKYNFLEGNKLK